MTYTASIEVDRKALRAQVFNEGWRIMKNRFYDAEDARRELGRDAKTKYEPLLDYLVDQEELQTVMMMMIGELNASHTGVSGGPPDAGPSTRRRRAIRASTLVARRVRLLQASATSTRTARPITIT